MARHAALRCEIDVHALQHPIQDVITKHRVESRGFVSAGAPALPGGIEDGDVDIPPQLKTPRLSRPGMDIGGVCAPATNHDHMSKPQTRIPMQTSAGVAREC